MKAKSLGLLITALLAGSTGAHAATISYSLGVFDFESPSIFEFTFFTPITPITGLARYSFTGSLALTDELSIAPLGLPEYWRLTVFSPATILADVGGTVPLTDPGAHSFAVAGLFDCAALGGCSGLQLELFFTTIGEGDGIFSTGTFSFEAASAVPEPGTLAMVAIGLVGLGLSRRHKAN